MGVAVPFWLAQFMAVKGLAALGVGLIVYLSWLTFREQRRRRKYRQYRRHHHRRSQQQKAEQRRERTVGAPPP